MEVNSATQTVTNSTPDPLGILITVVLVILGILGLAGWGYWFWPYFRSWHKARGREKDSLKFVLLQVTVPRGNEVKIDAAEQLMAALYAIKISDNGFMGMFKGFKRQPFISFEIVALPESIRFYIACHKKHQDLVEKQINGAYSDAQIKEVPEYNIFSESGQVAYSGFKLRAGDHFPIKTYKELPTDPMSALTSALSKMQQGEGAVVQIMISPADSKWKNPGKAFVKKEKDPGKGDSPKAPPDQKQLEAVEGKLARNGFETIVRVVTSSSNKDLAKAHLANIKSAFEQFNGTYNGFSGIKLKGEARYENLFLKNGEFNPFGFLWGHDKVFYSSEEVFIEDFVYRFMPKYDKLAVLTADEIASVYHFPNKSIETPHIQWLPAKSAPPPEEIPTEGLYIGKSLYRGVERPVYMADYDRQRHMYVIGRTGVGKTQFMQNLMLQDILSGKGLCFIDPHGDAAEFLLGIIPPNRAQDVIYWEPSDTDRPFGMNMLEHYSEEQKHFVVESIIGLLYKLYDPNKTGIIGPRLEHAVRNCLLTVMAVPGGTLIEVVRALTDTKYVQEILPLVQDPLVRRYWTDQIAQTTEFHKSETLDYFVSKFGKFVTNLMLRNIIGQSQPSINIRQAMDNQKILIVNLSKGRLGEDNSQFLGLILVPKILAAAMSRADIPEEQRKDFYLYVDEFQNFATDTFATILSEARKYKLNLIVANQFIGQMTEDVKNAIFGNVGTIMAFRTGVSDANFLQNEFQPVFNEQDILNIEAFHAYMKTQVRGRPVSPFSIDTTKDFKTWNELFKPDVARAIRELSRLTYGRDKHAVELEISQRSHL